MIAHPKACIAAGHPATAHAGAEILRAGGNAIDAAIAAVCTAFIAEPVLTAAGGGGFMLIRNSKGENRLFDGFSSMPEKKIHDISAPDFRAIPINFADHTQTFHIGRASIANPSLMAMLFAAHKNHGRLPIREVLTPAIEAARDGIRLNALQASFIKLLEPILTSEKLCQQLHHIDKKLLSEGELFQNKDLANTLELLAIEGIDEMYHGDIARVIASSTESGGLLTMKDLQKSQVKIRKPLSAPLFGGTLLTNPLPSSGGCLISFAGLLLDQLFPTNSQINKTPFPILMAEVLRETSRSRGFDFDEKVHLDEFKHQFLNDKRIKQSLQHIQQRLSGNNLNAMDEIENRHGSTTHISVIDADGMAVSLTSSNGEGSGIIAEGTGIHLNNMLGEEDINPLGFHQQTAGTRLSSMMAPSIFVRDGKPIITLGSGGSNRLRGAILQVLTRHVLLGEDIETSVHAPRLHNEGNTLDVEPEALSQNEYEQLKDLGWNINSWKQPSVYFGGVHTVCMEPKGQLHGVGDARRGGFVAWV
ncbi:MAG: gamma-glutamyltransferase [Mariprofundaceae bacterium]